MGVRGRLLLGSNALWTESLYPQDQTSQFSVLSDSNYK